jgi:FkbM family methyltransferase
MNKIKEVKGISYIIKNPNDMIEKTLLDNLQWNNDIIETINELIVKYNLTHFLNIGSHIGTVSLPISKNIEKVTAVEAFYPTFCHLVENINLNNIKNINVLNVAIGDKKETIHFLTNDARWKDNSGGMRVITEMDKKYNIRFSNLSDNSISCEMFPLDEIDEVDNFDIMLIDIEGMEARFLQGAKNKILKNKPIIIIEIWDNKIRKHEHLLVSREGVINHIIELGYTFYKNIDDDFIFLPN